MGKTKITKQLESRLITYTNKIGVYGCLEVTIGIGGRERVDYLTIDNKDVVRCYEIKSSKSDFFSSAKHTFIGNYNYYVMPNELYEEVKNSIPSKIGVFDGFSILKKPKRVELTEELNTIKTSIIRSLSRDYKKFFKSTDMSYFSTLNYNLNSYKDKYYLALNDINKLKERYNHHGKI